MNLNQSKIRLALVLGLALCASLARADQQELQVGYVFDGWTSDSLLHGYENRVPLSYYFSSPNLSLSLNTAFVAGNYMEDADPFAGITGSSYNTNNLTDTTLGVNWGFQMGNSLRSTLTGTLNFPTGDQAWEIAEQVGAVPFVFEPSYYRGAGWGGNLFYTLSASNPSISYGLGLGYISTGYYDTGLSTEGTFSPGDSAVAMANLGFRVSDTETWALRFVQTIPMESTYPDPSQNFTEGAASMLTTQWTSRMGKDKLVINASYSFYGAGSTAQTTTPYSLATDPGPYFGGRLDIHPIFGYSLGPGVVMESGLVWDWIQPNGYPQIPPVGSPNAYQGGGNLLGAEQSITFQLSPGTFWNLAGIYHFIANNNAGYDTQTGINDLTIHYQRFTLGTNVGLKW